MIVNSSHHVFEISSFVGEPPRDMVLLCRDASGVLPHHLMGNGARHSVGNGARPRRHVPVHAQLRPRLAGCHDDRSHRSVGPASVTGTSPGTPTAAFSLPLWMRGLGLGGWDIGLGSWDVSYVLGGRAPVVCCVTCVLSFRFSHRLRPNSWSRNRKEPALLLFFQGIPLELES